jgi:hypothetical protein
VSKLTLVNEATESEYPGEGFLDDFAFATCGEEASSYLFPTEESWDQGDRTITCLVEP